MKFKNLLISGGGTKCITILGSLKYLIVNKYFEKMETIATTSAGALCAFLLLIGYTIDEILILFDKTAVDVFTDFSFDNLSDKYGANNGKKLMALLQASLKEKFGITDVTFADFYKRTNVNFVICGANLTNSRPDFFDYKKYPNMSIIKAIKITTSLPAFFTKEEMDGKTYVDGGVFNNTPSDYFSKKELKKSFAIGFTHNNIFQTDSIEGYFMSLFLGMNTYINKKNLEICPYHIEINCPIDLFDFEKGKEKKSEFLNIGFKTTELYFQNNILQNENHSV